MAVHVPRSCNEVAHTLASLGASCDVTLILSWKVSWLYQVMVDRQSAAHTV